MLPKITPYTIVGLEGALIKIEADIFCDLPSRTILGLFVKQIQTNQEHLWATIENSDPLLPSKRLALTLSLTSTNLRKGGFLMTSLAARICQPQSKPSPMLRSHCDR